MKRHRLTRLTLSALPLLLAGCAMGPNYKRPPVETPPAYKEDHPPAEAVWKEAVPSDEIAKGDWWKVFHDATLNDLEAKAASSNQNLRAAVARVTEARAAARITEADFFPNITLDPSAVRTRVTSRQLNPPGSVYPSYTGNNFQVPLDLSYEVDIWGRIRRSFEASAEEARASVADYETVLLTLKSDVAQDYFSLRSLDAEHDLLVRTVDLRRKALDLVRTRFQGGVSSELDVAQAETELASVQAQAADTGVRRSQLEHALAVLTGQPASSFSLPEHPLDLGLPRIPAGLPSELLERRPDVAKAERTMAANNARIGVAKAAFFPVVRLTGNVGFESSDISNLFAMGSRSWGFGPSISIPVFDAGVNSANLRKVKAQYEESAALYRQQVLVAFADVEDGLSGLRILADESQAQDRATEAAGRAADISDVRYRSGLVNYLQIVDAERTYLDNQRLQVQLNGQRFVTTVALVKALGGGWQDSNLLPATAKPKAGKDTTPVPVVANFPVLTTPVEGVPATEPKVP
jgi:multidrug efflux system outer membrane protein